MNAPPQAERANSPFLCLFIVFRPSMDGKVDTHSGEGDLDSVYLPTQMLILSGNPVQTYSEIVPRQLSGHPLAPSR